VAAIGLLQASDPAIWEYAKANNFVSDSDFFELVTTLGPPPKVLWLTGDRKGTWSLHVTRNWRMTFWIDAEKEIQDVNFEDYH